MLPLFICKMKQYQLKRRPKAYQITEQQKNFINALKFCQIKKGIKKAELQGKMKTCIPQYFKDLKEQQNVGEQGKEKDYALQPQGL